MSKIYPDATQIAEVVRGHEISAKAIVAAALARIATHNRELNCFTNVLADTALAEAENIDEAIAKGEKLKASGK